MIRVLIADDEERIRNGLAKLVQAASSQYVITGTFGNGAELLAELKQHGADVVITDIRMPLMSGLQLAEKLQEDYPEVRTIILSGYSDFEYARRAIRCKVSEYLVKPVDKKQLYDVLAEIEQSIEQDRLRESQERIARLEHYLFADGSLPEGIMRADLGAWIFVRTEKAVGMKTLHAICQDIIPDQYDLVICGERQYAILYHIERSRWPDADQAHVEVGRELLQALGRISNATIGVSRPFDDEYMLENVYQETADLADSALYQFESQVLVVAGERKQALSEEWDKAWDEQLLTVMEVLDRARIEELLRELFAVLSVKRLPLRLVLNRLIWIMHMAGRALKEFERTAAAAGFHEKRIREYLQQMYRFSSFADWYVDEFIQVIERISSNRSATRAVDKVKAIIEKEYREELDLTRLAERVYLTPSYLSKLFKQETGLTITDYVISLRIDQAKKLLRERTDLKAYEVGELAGYPDSAYFAKIFKKMTGITPNEYRNLVR